MFISFIMTIDTTDVNNASVIGKRRHSTMYWVHSWFHQRNSSVFLCFENDCLELTVSNDHILFYHLFWMELLVELILPILQRRKLRFASLTLLYPFNVIRHNHLQYFLPARLCVYTYCMQFQRWFFCSCCCCCCKGGYYVYIGNRQPEMLS